MKNNITVRKFKNYLISVLCIFYSYSLFSQTNFSEGYIIKNDNDTVFGLIKIQERVQHAKECVFLKDSGSRTIKYLPSDIIGYRFNNGKYYVSNKISYQLNSDKIKQMDNVIFDREKGTFYINNNSENATDSEKEVQNVVINKNVFLEYLIDGNVDVYLYVDDANKSLYFIRKEEDSLIYLENTSGVIYNQWNDDYFIEKKEYIGILNYVLQDCEGIQSKISNLSLNNESLIKIAEYYHDQTCSNVNEPCIIYEKQNRKTHLSVIPLITFSNMKVTASELNSALNYDFINKKNISYGVSVKFSNFQYINQHLFSQLSILLHNQSFQTEDISTNIEFKVLEIPIGINYSFLLNSKIKPFIGLSINPNYRMEMNLVTSTSHNSDFLMSQINSLYITLSGITGIEFYLNKNLFLTTAFKCKFGGAFYNSSNTKDNSKSSTLAFQLGLGYRFNND